ncbi:DUF6082 family protein [Nonomuraea sp. NPDC004702]
MLITSDTGVWSLLNALGLTYSQVAALLHALALIGVASSIAWQTKDARGQERRRLHNDLLKMAMNDPLYLACWGDFFADDDERSQRAHLYLNMVFNTWLLMWEQRSITEAHLRGIAWTVLSSPSGRVFWQQVRDLRMSGAGSRRERRFNRVIDDVYQRVVSAHAI